VSRTRLLFVAATVALGALLLRFGVLPALRDPRGDFVNYWAASRLAFEGRFRDPRLYEIGVFQDEVERFIPGTLASFLPFPPATALALLPLAPLPPAAAKAVLTGAKLLMLAAIVWLLRENGTKYTSSPRPPGRRSVLSTVLLVLLGGFGLWSDFRQGQLYVPLLLSLVGALELHRRGHDLAAGLALGALLPIKYAAAALILWFLASGRWRVVLGAMLAAGVVGALGLALAGPALHRAWLAEVLPAHLAGRLQDPFGAVFQSWGSLLNRLFVREVSLNPHPLLDAPRLRAFLATFLAVGLAGVVVAALLRRRRDARHAAALLTLLTLVTAPATATYHYVLAILPAAFLRGPGLVLYASVALFPAWLLFPLDGRGLATLACYGKLYLATAWLLISIPREVWRSRAPAVVLAAALLAGGAVALALREPAPDGAAWAGFDGLVLRDLAVDGRGVWYRRETPQGFAPFVNGAPADRPPPPPRRVSRDGAWRLEESGGDVHARNLSTGEVRRLTIHPARDSAPVWSADDRRVWFLSDRGRGLGCPTVYVADFR
jgi:hypothetical protein